MKTFNRKKRWHPRIVRDWEERVSMFLRDAIASPHKEPEVCEELCEFMAFVAERDRDTYRRACERVLKTLIEDEGLDVPASGIVFRGVDW